jgi:hypothetical protein
MKCNYGTKVPAGTLLELLGWIAISVPAGKLDEFCT